MDLIWCDRNQETLPPTPQRKRTKILFLLEAGLVIQFSLWRGRKMEEILAPHFPQDGFPLLLLMSKSPWYEIGHSDLLTEWPLSIQVSKTNEKKPFLSYASLSFRCSSLFLFCFYYGCFFFGPGIFIEEYPAALICKLFSLHWHFI